MKTRETQGSFIALIWTLIAKVKDVTNASNVLIHPQADIVADLILQPTVFRSMQRRLAEDASLNHRVYRFSNVDNATSPCWSGGPSKLYSR